MPVMERTHGWYQRDGRFPGTKAVDGSTQRGHCAGNRGLRGIGIKLLGMAFRDLAACRQNPTLSRSSLHREARELGLAAGWQRACAALRRFA